MSYTPSFSPRYPDWEDRPSENTPADALTFEKYDAAIQNIETFLDGSTALKPVSKTSAMTQQVGVDSNGALYTAPGGGGGSSSASDVSYDNTQSGLIADDVQDAIDEVDGKIGDKVNAVEKTQAMTQDVGIDSNGRLYTAPGGGGGGGTADDITYDNTYSGLQSSNVQDAIDELSARAAEDISYDNTQSGLTATDIQAALDEVAQGSSAVPYNMLHPNTWTTDTVIYFGDDLYGYRTTGDITESANTSYSVDMVYDVESIISCGGFWTDSDGNKVQVPMNNGNKSAYIYYDTNDTKAYFVTKDDGARTDADYDVWILYVEAHY